MSEKLYEIKQNSDNGKYWLFNNDRNSCLMISENIASLLDICNVLNEQQATIQKLQDLCGESDYENARSRQKNKELQDKIDWLCENMNFLGEYNSMCLLMGIILIARSVSLTMVMK